MPFFMPITLGARDFSSVVSGFCHSLAVDRHRVEVNPKSAKICRFRRGTSSPKFGVIKFLCERALFAAQTQSFLCSKFFTSRLEVLPNLRHGRVFQMSTMVNFGILLTRR